MLTPDSFNPRLLWMVLPTPTRLYVLFLVAFSVYVVLALAHALYQLSSVKRGDRAADSTRATFATMRSRLLNLRQFIFFSFLLFGICFVIQMPAALSNTMDSNRPLLQVFYHLEDYLGYSADVLSVFMFLHCFQWFVAARVNALARRQQL